MEPGYYMVQSINPDGNIRIVKGWHAPRLLGIWLPANQRWQCGTPYDEATCLWYWVQGGSDGSSVAMPVDQAERAQDYEEQRARALADPRVPKPFGELPTRSLKWETVLHYMASPLVTTAVLRPRRLTLRRLSTLLQQRQPNRPPQQARLARCQDAF